MNRRDFFVRIGGVALAVPVALKLGACSDDTPPDEPDANVEPDAPPQALCTDGTNVTIGPPEEPHEMIVTTQDVEAGVDKTYDIQGGAGHNHTVTLTAGHFAMLAAGETVVVTSSNEVAHTHEITVVCV